VGKKGTLGLSCGVVGGEGSLERAVFETRTNCNDSTAKNTLKGCFLKSQDEDEVGVRKRLNQSWTGVVQREGRREKPDGERREKNDQNDRTLTLRADVEGRKQEEKVEWTCGPEKSKTGKAEAYHSADSAGQPSQPVREACARHRTSSAVSRYLPTLASFVPR
jgi:hypothetical protein